MGANQEWLQCDTKTFWGDVAADDHVVQLYDNENVLIATLADFATGGFKCGSSVVVIATEDHLAKLDEELLSFGFDLEYLMAFDQYIRLDAEQTLAKFMVNGSPDEKYFLETIKPIIERARKNGRQVRAFGEMVALLWARGNNKATLHLEALWNKFFEEQTFCLFCAYPKSVFENDPRAAVMHICGAHTHLLKTSEDFPSHIQYKKIV